MTDAFLSQLKKQSIVIAGAGRSGLATLRFLTFLGVKATLADDTKEAYPKLADTLLEKATWVVLSPGIPRAHPALQKAVLNGTKILNELDLAALYLPNTRFVGITGTNGKSTTTTLLGSIAKVYDPTAFVGGNLGIPFCEALAKGEKPQLAILELSSFQLETLSHLKLDTAVVTNLSPDHLDRYSSEEAYYGAKARIFALLKPSGISILNRQDTLSMEHLPNFVKGPCSYFNTSEKEDGVLVGPDFLKFSTSTQNHRFSIDTKKILGEHNRENAAAAVAAALSLQIPFDTIQKGLDDYPGLAHRLESVGNLKGVQWINDSKATNVESAIKSVESFDQGIHLIVGGLGKGSSYAPFVQACTKRVKAVYTIGQDAPLLLGAFQNLGVPLHDAKTLENAVQLAHTAAIKGDTILLAPACASYDQFDHFEHRGNCFKALFQKRQTTPSNSA